MAKVTSKLQVTVPKAIADRYKIRAGDEIEWVPAGIRFVPYLPAPLPLPSIHRRDSKCSTSLRLDYAGERSTRIGTRESEVGVERTCTIVAVLVDTNILVYRFDSRFPDKQKIATDILRRGILEDSIRLPHQAIVEFVAAVTRPIKGSAILERQYALREAEEFLMQFTVLYPNDAIVRSAIRACAAYQLNWFDAHIWAYADHYGLSDIITEDLQHDRYYGSVRAVNPCAEP